MQTSQERPRVLVVDDDEEYLSAALRVLELVDCDAAGVLTASDALLCAAICRPHLMLIDYSLPDMTGADLARKIDAVAGVEQLRKVIITSWPEERVAPAVVGAGVERIVHKPATWSDIKALVHGAPPAR